MFSSNGHFDEMSRHFVEILSLLLTILFKNKAYFFFFFFGGGGGGGGRGNKRVIDSHLQFCMCSKFSFIIIIRLLCRCAAVPAHEAYIAHTAHPASLVILSRSRGGSRGGSGFACLPAPSF